MKTPDLALSPSDVVLRIRDLPEGQLQDVLRDYGLTVVLQPANEAITGSYWGGEEAGLVKHCLHVRADTPVHSALHEACHFICMDDERRSRLYADAGGDFDEENGVCYLQILLSGRLAAMGMQRMFGDMDRWGYTFRLGSAERWFRCDASDARSWLELRGLLIEETPLARP